MKYLPILPEMIDIARQAGQIILQYYQDLSGVSVTNKSDQSPLTQADLAAHHRICQGLSDLNLGWPIISEESSAVPDLSLTPDYYWLVDPLDGTKEFLSANDEFTVNIALMQCDKSVASKKAHYYPVMSVIYVPALDTLYYAALGQGAHKQAGSLPVQRIQCCTSTPNCWSVAVSRSHASPALQQALQSLERYRVVSAGSSLKFCLVAEGAVHFYPRLGPTSQWDIAAGQCIIEQAGGQVVNLVSQKRFSYCYRTCQQLNEAFLALGAMDCTEWSTALMRDTGVKV